MATVEKNFRIKQGLTVEGASGTINGSNILTEASTEFLQDTVGAMVSTNNEGGIAVTYDDTNGKLDFNVDDFTITLGGDLSGSVTITNLANGTLNATIGANSVALGTDTTGDFVAGITAGTGISVSGSGGEGSTVTITNDDRGSAQNIFKTVAANGTSIVADSNSDTLTITPGTGITITGDASTDTVTITNGGVTQVTGTTNEIEVSAGTGSVTIGLPDNVTIGNNLTVTGNLTVNGTTTTLNTETLAVEDNIVVLNTNVTGTPTADAGIEVERGDYTNAKIYWKESENAWYLSTPGDSNGAATDAVISTGGSVNVFNNLSDGTNVASPDNSNDTFTFTAGTGVTAVVSSAGDSLTITNTGVTSLAGTADQIIANASTGSVSLSLPQSINTTSSVTFANVNVTSNVVAARVELVNASLGSATATASGTSVDLDVWSATTYSTAKYIIQAKNGSGDIEVTELLVTVDGSNNVYITEFANMFSNASLAEFTAAYATGNVTLSATSTTSGVVFKVSKTYIEA